jgi:hypothetical protein
MVRPLPLMRFLFTAFAANKLITIIIIFFGNTRSRLWNSIAEDLAVA